MSQISLIPFESIYLEKYQRFARKYYGTFGYQAKINYINWLYNENPSSSNYKDFTLAITETAQIVGCIHKMRFDWKYKGHKTAVPAVHNLMVDENYRRVTGLRLIQASVANEQHVFMPGTVSKPVIGLFQLLQYQKMNVLWYRKILRPVNGVLTYLTRKYLHCSNKGYYFDPSKLRNFTSTKFTITMLPENSLLEQLAFLMNSTDAKIIAPFWEDELLRWRFFHPLGPKHVLIYENFTETINNFAIVSLGPRRGLNLGRILAMNSPTAGSLKQLMAQIVQVIKQNGGHLLQFVSADDRINHELAEINWSSLSDPPATYIYHKDKKQIFEHCSFGGAAGDFGFEAIQ